MNSRLVLMCFYFQYDGIFSYNANQLDLICNTYQLVMGQQFLEKTSKNNKSPQRIAINQTHLMHPQTIKN